MKSSTESKEIGRIMDALKADSRRDIYEVKYPRDEFWITYQGGGPFTGCVVRAMASEGLLIRKYPDCECYAIAPNDKIHERRTNQAGSDRNSNVLLPRPAASPRRGVY